jgi:putative heme-binding domain-containing protein
MASSRRLPGEFGRAALYLAIVLFGGIVHADEARPAWTGSKFKGTPVPPAPYAIRPAFPNLKFSNPTSLSRLPDGRLLVTEIGGMFYTFSVSDRQTTKRDLMLQIEDSSVWHATIHPKFQSNGLLFVCYSKDGTTHVSRFRVQGSPPRADPGSEEVLLTWPAGGHNAGCLEFGKDQKLYISTGDGSGPNPPDGRTAAQDISNLFGCILRIDVDRKDAGNDYAVPPDNPFVDLDGARPEIWAYGLRNPWKFGVDHKTGNIFAADNGWESWEMVHQIVRGGNCGWPIMEGRAILRSEVKQGPTPIRPPVKDHSHKEANSVIGGPVYRGAKLADLQGTFVYGDYITGTIWGLKAGAEQNYSHRTLVDTDLRITAFAEGSAGELFVVDYDFTGQIYELVPSGLEDLSAEFPRRLAETGLFTTIEPLKPAPGVVPYDVVVKRWMDGAVIKHHWVAIPGNASIKLADGDQPAEYPDGTVFVKHIVMGTELSLSDPIGGSNGEVPLETQILHYENGIWHPYSYLWTDIVGDERHRDAMLVDTTGTSRQVVHHEDEYGIRRGPQWHVNAENECRMCHNAGAGFVLGFKANQLRRSVFRSDDEKLIANQLDQFVAEQELSSQPPLPADNSGRLVNPHDATAALDDRARSYLDVNCSSCHHPRGNAIVSFYLRRDLPFDQLRTDKGTGIGTFGMRNAKIIVPGDPYRSILLYRMTKLGYGRMPYIGSRAVDSRGVALIEEWIRSMPHESRPIDSTPVQNGSRDELALSVLKRQQQTPQFQELDQEPASFLFESTEGALAVAVGIHAKSINRMNLGTASVRTNGPDRGTGVFMESAAFRKLSSDIRGLFVDFIPPSMRRPTLGQKVDPAMLLSLKGDSDRGRLIYFSDGARCNNCHHTNDPTKSTGPTLTEIRKKYPRRSEMLQHILRPSLKVDDKFAMWTVVTAQGRVINGLLIIQDPNNVVLKTAERKTVQISKSDIEDIQKSTKSLMPEGVLSDLTAQEAADLLAWFNSN